MQNDRAHTHILRKNALKMARQLFKFMDLARTKKTNMWKNCFFLSVARVKQFASTAFSGGIAALFDALTSFRLQQMAAAA